jgi:hypothetical protein
MNRPTGPVELDLIRSMHRDLYMTLRIGAKL